MPNLLDWNAAAADRPETASTLPLLIVPVAAGPGGRKRNACTTTTAAATADDQRQQGAAESSHICCHRLFPITISVPAILSQLRRNGSLSRATIVRDALIAGKPAHSHWPVPARTKRSADPICSGRPDLRTSFC
jgi:hypothetical protein